MYCTSLVLLLSTKEKVEQGKDEHFYVLSFVK